MKNFQRVFFKVVVLAFFAVSIEGIFAPMTTAHALDMDTPAEPEIVLNYVDVTSCYSGISFSGAYATCTGRCAVDDPGLTVVLQISLKKLDGASWTTLKSWSKSSSGALEYRLSQGYSVATKSNSKYKTTTVAKIYRSSGSLVESVTLDSRLYTY